MTNLSWRNRLAHAASPWDWTPPAFAVYVVIVLAASVLFVAVPLVRTRSGVGLFPVAIGLLAAGIYLRALVRAVRLRRATVEVTTSLR